MVSRIESPAWFALYTRHQHEKSVAHALQSKGIEVFLPLYNTLHRWKDRTKQMSLPLFPNYVFVFVDLESRGAILSSPGIYDFVRAAGWPAAIPIEEVEAVRKVVERGLSAEPHPFLNSGDCVRVKSGPLEGVEGILVRKKSFYRLVLSVELLARSISVELDVADVDRVAERSAGFASFATSAAAPGGY
jgi:transcription termination/antitermination protein NusG